MSSVLQTKLSDGKLPREDGQRAKLEYQTVRNTTQGLCKPLCVDDYGVQTISEVSPPKWHLAHTTWFFETFLLQVFYPHYQPFHPRYGELFNSYYETLGGVYPRAKRGWLSRPTIEEIYRYRAYVDQHMLELIDTVTQTNIQEFSTRLTLGIHHEQQHQELLLTDIKHILSANPLRPAYFTESKPLLSADRTVAKPDQPNWLSYHGGLFKIGYDGDGFAFDNETPRHETYLHDYQVCSRLVTNEEYLEFIDSGAYTQPQYWLSDGWIAVRKGAWQAPLYWERINGEWWIMTLSGLQPLAAQEPVCHVSFYEADAYARWRGQRLPSEAEWEHIAASVEVNGNLQEQGRYHPEAAPATAKLSQLFGDVWEWTSSPYQSYPGYHLPQGVFGEYNGKFMCNQLVLRGGSCVTPQTHLRASYRNFFYPHDRWQFSGIRLAKNAN